ncbi:MAG: hypothetical protein ACOC5T_05010 [Elusimicrobiota bacterium]
MISVQDYYSNDDGKTTTVEVRNMFRVVQKETFNVPLEKFTEGIKNYNNGQKIQEAFPFLSDEEREFMMSGLTFEEQKSIFGE